ncbi:hypothetical protein [Cyclobacterium qasimii]|uniref:Dihydrolipoamide dehydrogenase n=2 Tax=Cyclobacterium qasimii TaxID=1350429 RepID=S7VC40_9BACT|nr:hypothetical protein [Cyclobacterium qasimii]EPR67551.1 hypothetical protein ADICYQ_3575 [Cyclobacterium qasimii M12-11B]GEO21715.1 hypothetical protein CQA01_22490 [Cyclobacterium qasimii]
MNRYNRLLSMKSVLVFAAAFVMLGCEGPVGPTGATGADGTYIVGEVFEIEGNFNQAGNFGISGEYGFDILESDKVLIYRLADYDQDGNDIWRLIPQVVFHTNGIFTYDYDFTFYDYSIFLTGDFDLNSLESGYTADQIFRVLILPADRIDLRMDYSDHEAVLEMMGVDEKDIQRKRLN